MVLEKGKKVAVAFYMSGVYVAKWQQKGLGYFWIFYLENSKTGAS